MKKIIFIVVILCSISLNAQAPLSDELVTIHSVTTLEMNAIVAPVEGDFAYNKTTKTMFFYDGTDWVEMVANTPSIYVGHLVITNVGVLEINDVPFKPSSITFTAHSNIETTNINSDNGVGNNNNGVSNAFGSMNGYARDDNNLITQQVIFVGGSGNSINDISRYSNPTQCIGIRYSNQNGDNLGLTTANLMSFDDDGFTLDVTNRTDNLVVLYTAYK